MSQYRARKKALNQKRDQMMDLFVDSRIKLANKPTVYGEFYDYVTDLDRPAPKPKRLSAKAAPQAKPAMPAQSTQAAQTPVQQQAKPAPKQNPKTVQPETKAVDQRTKKAAPTKGKGGIWDSYTE